MTRTALVSRRVFTGEEDQALPRAVVVEGDRIAQVLSANEFLACPPKGVEVRDLGDSFLCPGLIDAHQHVLQAALFPSDVATEYLGTSEADCVRHMRDFAVAHPSDGWLLSHGWRETAWGGTTMPSRHSLDEAFPTRPVAMYSGDAHTLWVNTAGLGALGVDENSVPPTGGSYDRDEEGRLTGIIREAAAMECVSRVMASFSDEDLVPVYRSYLQRLAAMGITGVADMALSLIPGADGIRPGVYEALLACSELPVRVHLFPTLGDDETNLEDLQARLKGPMLQAPGFKQFFDGVSSQHTAWCTEEYANPRFPGDVGRPTIDAGRMRGLVLAAAARGHAVRIHAIGDRAVHEAIAIFAEAHERYGEPAVGANTIEHIEDIRPEDIDLLAQAGVVASVQPPHAAIEVEQPERDLGKWRADRMWPFRTMLERGVTLAFGTDAPVVPPTSTDVLFTAVTRQEPETHLPKGGWNPWERVSQADALRAFTAGSAAALGRSHEFGRIAPGMLADLVAWDTDLLACCPEDLQHARALATWVGGTCVHDANRPA